MHGYHRDKGLIAVAYYDLDAVKLSTVQTFKNVRKTIYFSTERGMNLGAQRKLWET